jgi:hypothetical protein
MSDHYDDAKEERTKQFLLDQARRATLRSKDREFHGLQREFMYLQAEMLIAYERSKDIRHPRDVGDAREQILRQFLLTRGYLPKRYGVSERRARVASTTGHVTGELDILLYDDLNSLSLMRREDVYEVFPVESVYGVIQVKSRLNKKEISDGLENIASFKRLECDPGAQRTAFITSAQNTNRGFGLLFAYDSDLKWEDIVEEIAAFSNRVPNTQWCNAVFILNKGMFLHGEGGWSASINSAIERITKLSMHGYPDRQEQCLYQFYNVLLNLLRTTDVQHARIERYFSLPFVADAYSYEFCMGAAAEMGRCPQHGDYQRKIAPDKLEKIIACCSKTEPINWIKAIDIAYGRPGDNTEAYERQPCDVRIYNPDNFPLSEVLLADQKWGDATVKGLAFDQVRCRGMVTLIPYYYAVTQCLISGCPACAKEQMSA